MPWTRPRARAFAGATVIAGSLVFVAALPYVRVDRPLLYLALLVLSSAAGATKVSLPLPASGSTMFVSYGVDFAALLLLGPHQAMFIVAGGAFCDSHLHNRPRDRSHAPFAIAAAVLAVQAAGFVFHALGGNETAAPSLATLGGPLIVAAAVYFLIDTSLSATASALDASRQLAVAWREEVGARAPSCAAGAAAAAVSVWFILRAGYWVPFTFAPIYLTYRTYKVYRGRIEDEQRHVQRTSDLHLATIEALARAIDAKDQTAHMHIRRVQLYAIRLAKSAGLDEVAIRAVETAALLHDIGKLAVPEHILSKPGPLTAEEFQKIRIHPQIGAEIIAAVPFPYPVAPIILSHHERWDGQGYPQGLAANAIPVGARVLTIVDYFDAITSERPYHKPMTLDGAIELLRSEAGRALDPLLVPMFIELLPSIVCELGPEAVDAAPETHDADVAGAAAPHTRPARAATVFDNIALAHREIYALYEIAKSMGTSLGVSDTMALISSKISKIVPWSGCALFLTHPDGESLECRFAAGVDAPRLLNATLKPGDWPGSWVAGDRRTLVNADPAVLFDRANVGAPAAVKATLVCPLHFNEAFIGMLALYHVEPAHYSEDHRRLLERIAEQAGAVIHNSIVFEQTQEDSLTDPLTGLPNRRSMFVHLSRELARAERGNHEVALIVMDVDGFKRINDTYGHSVGDHALRRAAEALLGGLRSYDLCVRYAGDEFIIVLAECPREMAESRLRELQGRVAEVQLEVRPGKRIHLGASAGVAVFPHDGTSYESLLAEADHRMYRDKSARRALGRPSHMPITDSEVVDAGIGHTA